MRGVSFDIQRAETLGIVGESGCGKSTIAFGIVNFLGRNGKIVGGDILFQGQNLVGKPDGDLRKIRGDRIAMVYQDPMQALNPSMRLGDQMSEVLIVHRGMDKQAAEAKCVQMLERVYMPDAANVMKRFPHQISGGQQQRVVIAMALLNDPALLIMDEPTTALDVTVEAAVLDLIADLQRDFDTAIMYISHNLGVVARVADRVAVMYAGEMVERATVGDVFLQPYHPYTQGLMRCVPRLGQDKSGQLSVPDPRPGAVAQGAAAGVHLRAALHLRPAGVQPATARAAGGEARPLGALPLRRGDRPGGVEAAGRFRPGVHRVWMPPNLPTSPSSASNTPRRFTRRHPRRSSAPGSTSRPWTTSASKCSRARPSASSANRAAARAPW